MLHAYIAVVVVVVVVIIASKRSQPCQADAGINVGWGDSCKVRMWFLDAHMPICQARYWTYCVCMCAHTYYSTAIDNDPQGTFIVVL